MSKKKQIVNSTIAKPIIKTTTAETVEQNEPETGVFATETSSGFWQKITTGFVPYIIITIFGFVLYANTFHHEYALDDDIIICKNEYVLEGVKAFPEIFTSDVFASFYKQMNTTAQLSGGRYRPFSVATFALEQEFIGTIPNGTIAANAWDINKNGLGDPSEDINKDGLYNEKDVKVKGMGLRHVDNVLLYILSICIIYLFFTTYFFKNNKVMAMLICLLFMAHPLHTEVVANVKSRDEILSLLFMMLTLFFSFKYVEFKKMKNLLWACVCYIIALLSKEYGASLMIIVPLALYVYFQHQKIAKFVPITVALGITFLIYYTIRHSIVLSIDESEIQNSELLNNPYLLADETQKMATEIYMNLRYFIMLLVPTPLSCDYSYNVIPYKTYSDPSVWASIIVLIGGFAALFYTTIKRHWLAVPLAFILVHLFMVNNLFFNIGATMGERLVYHSSLGICILLVYGVYYLFTIILKNKNQAYAFLLLPVIVLYSIKTIARNPAWKNDICLHLTDVKTYPNSTMLNGNACTRLIEMAEMPINKNRENNLLDSAAMYGRKSLVLHDKFVNSYLNMGIIFAKQNKLDSAEVYWNKVREMYPHHPQLPLINQNLSQNFYNQGIEFAQKGNLNEALPLLDKAYKYYPNNPKLCYDLGVVCYNLGNKTNAKKYWQQSLKIDPTNANTQKALNSVLGY